MLRFYLTLISGLLIVLGVLSPGVLADAPEGGCPPKWTGGTATGTCVYNDGNNNINVSAQVPEQNVAEVNQVSPSESYTDETQDITIYGQYFTNVHDVYFDDPDLTSLTNINVINSSELKATVPSGIVSGIYNIRVSNGAGTNIISDAKYTIKAQANESPEIVDSPDYILISPDGDTTESFTVSDSDDSSVDFDFLGLNTEYLKYIDPSSGKLSIDSGSESGEQGFTVYAKSKKYTNDTITLEVSDGTNTDSVSIVIYITS